MNEKLHRKVNPVVAVVIALAVVIVVGFLSMRLFGSTEGEGKSYRIKPANPNAKEFQPDPRLGGGS